MAIPVLMPQQGNTVEECLLVAWKKKKGDSIQKGDILAEIETDKAAFELEAPDSGLLLELFAKPGELVPVLTNIAVIGQSGESVEQFKPGPKSQKTSTPQKQPEKSPDKTTLLEVSKTSNDSSSIQPALQVGTPKLSPRARVFLKKHPVDLSQVRPSGAEGRIVETDLKLAWNNQKRPSHLAAALIADKAKAPNSGSGPNGMIRSSDLSAPGKTLTGIRAIIAERMLDSLFSTAQYSVNMQAQAVGLLGLRAKCKKAGLDITIGDMVMFACIQTLKSYPELNSELIDNTHYLHKSIHMGFACDTPRGLLVPVIKNSDQLSIQDLAKQVKALAQKAQENKISPDDLSGGTFTISNLGSFGVTGFSPVINAPQVAILGVCAITLQPVRKDGKVEFEDQIGFSLTSDHQVIDGAQSARFLQALTKNISDIETLSGLKF